MDLFATVLSEFHFFSSPKRMFCKTCLFVKIWNIACKCHHLFSEGPSMQQFQRMLLLFINFLACFSVALPNLITYLIFIIKLLIPLLILFLKCPQQIFIA